MFRCAQYLGTESGQCADHSIFTLDTTFASGHDLHVTNTQQTLAAIAVLMHKLTFQDICHRLLSAVRMVTEASLRPTAFEVVEQEDCRSLSVHEIQIVEAPSLQGMKGLSGPIGW